MVEVQSWCVWNFLLELQMGIFDTWPKNTLYNFSTNRGHLFEMSTFWNRRSVGSCWKSESSNFWTISENGSIVRFSAILDYIECVFDASGRRWFTLFGFIGSRILHNRSLFRRQLLCLRFFYFYRQQRGSQRMDFGSNQFWNLFVCWQSFKTTFLVQFLVQNVDLSIHFGDFNSQRNIERTSPCYTTDASGFDWIGWIRS